MTMPHHSSKDLPGRSQSAAQGRVVGILVLVVILITIVGSYFWYAG